MKIIELKCPECNSAIEVDAECKEAICKYCGTKFMIDDEIDRVHLENAEQTGYEFEKGRQRAMQEHNAYKHSSKELSKTNKIVLLGVLTAIVIVLQFLGSFIKFGPFSISLGLIPIVVGAALLGVGAGAWLGFVFGMIVLLSGDATPFMTVSVFGTITTVLLKGVACGTLAGLVYKAVEKKNKYAGTILAAVTAPVVNTGIFLLGCLVFFLPTVREWGAANGFESVGKYMIIGFVGFNFLFELLVNVVLSPVIVRIIDIGKKGK